MKKIQLFFTFFIIIGTLTLNAQTWNQLIKVCASDRAANDFYGYSVAISGDYAVVGAYSEDHDIDGLNTMTNSGSAYILQKIEGTWTEIQKIVASDRSGGDSFGYSVAIGGDYIVVGAYSEAHDTEGLNTMVNAGSAYIFKNNSGTWNEIQKIVASDRAEGDFFACSLSIDENYLIVGAFMEDENVNGGETLNNSGSAYIFENIDGVWEQKQKIVSNDRADADYFGYSVSISGNYAIVGAYAEDQNASGGGTKIDSGSAYIFLNTAGTWAQVQKIVAADRANSDYFGYSVAISGNYAIVGAYQEDQNVNGTATLENAGSAYIFKNNAGTWSQVQKIVSSDRAAGDQFGYSVSISGDYAIVGANLEDEDVAGENEMFSAGSVYIFKNTAGNWEQAQKIVPNDRASNDLFGTAVGICGTSIIVGAYQEDHDPTGIGTSFASNAGSVYFFGSSGAEINIKQNFTNIANEGSFDMGSIVFGNSSETVTFTIENIGSSDLILSGNPIIAISGEGSSCFTVDQSSVTSPIGAAGSTTFTISFSPAEAVAYSAQISIENNDADENLYNFVINGTGIITHQAITNSNVDGITVYPNPSSGRIYFDFADNKVEKILITDITGKIVLEKSDVVSSESIDLSMSPTGVYFVTIQTETGVFVSKIVKR